MAVLPSSTGCPGKMRTASSLQYETIFSTSFPAEARSAHSASRRNSFACSVAGSKPRWEQPASTRGRISAERSIKRERMGQQDEPPLAEASIALLSTIISHPSTFLVRRQGGWLQRLVRHKITSQIRDQPNAC